MGSLLSYAKHTHNDSPPSECNTNPRDPLSEGGREGGENAIYTSVGKRGGGRKLVSNRILLFFPIYHRGSSSSSRRRRTFSICPEVRRVETELFVAKPK